MGKKSITLPLDTVQCRALRAGDEVLLTGVLYTARDAAHAKLIDCLERGVPLPFSLENQTLYYAGPTPAPPGAPIGACGPTTAARMDALTLPLLKAGLKGMIGKGGRSEGVQSALKQYEAVYFAAIGGAAALIAESVKAARVVAFPELGTEAIRRLEVENFPAIVAMDSYGNSVYTSV